MWMFIYNVDILIFEYYFIILYNVLSDDSPQQDARA